jgi:hypothetical protein
MTVLDILQNDPEKHKVRILPRPTIARLYRLVSKKLMIPFVTVTTKDVTVRAIPE